ncbi:unnamed protein product [Arctogadus glacialis]
MEGEMNEYSSSTQNDPFAGEELGETTCNVTEDPTPSPAGPWTSRGALARLSRYGKHILPNSFSRRSGLQRQLEVSDSTPGAVHGKDFISGFSVLHWLAKSGHGETLTKLLKHAENVGSPADVNLRGSGGQTPLHVASMHSQFMVVKLLVGAFGAKVDVMDYNGKRAWQYLKGNAPLEMKELLGAWDEEHNTDYAQNANNSASCTPNPTPSVDPRLDEVDSLTRTRAEGRLVTSLRDLFQAFNFWGNK